MPPPSAQSKSSPDAPLPEPESGKLRSEDSATIKKRFRTERRILSQDYCGRGAVLGASPDLSELVVIPIRCKSWDCKPCSKRKAYAASMRIASGMPTKFITLTHKPDQRLTSPEAFAHAKAALSRLVKRIRRQFGVFEYCAIWELTKAGNPHVHIAARCAYIPQPWLSHAWRILAGAPIVDIRAVKSPHRIASYVIKYMLKSPALTVNALGGGRLIQVSQHYLPDAKQSDHERTWEKWTWKWIDIDFYRVCLRLDQAFDPYDWTQEHSGLLHVKAPDGIPLAAHLGDLGDDKVDIAADYAIEEARLDAELIPNTPHQADLFPPNPELTHMPTHAKPR